MRTTESRAAGTALLRVEKYADMRRRTLLGGGPERSVDSRVIIEAALLPRHPCLPAMQVARPVGNTRKSGSLHRSRGKVLDNTSSKAFQRRHRWGRAHVSDLRNTRSGDESPELLVFE